MIKYKLNGETVDVPLNEQKQFEIDNPTAKKIEVNSATEIEKSKKENQKIEEYIPQAQTMQENITPQINLQDQVEETDSSQNNQKKIEPIIEEEEEEIVKEEVAYPWSNTERDASSLFSGSIFDETETKPELETEREFDELTNEQREAIEEFNETPRSPTGKPIVEEPTYDWDSYIPDVDVDLPQEYQFGNQGQGIPYERYEEYANDLTAELPNASEERKKEIEYLLPVLEQKQDHLQRQTQQLPDSSIIKTENIVGTDADLYSSDDVLKYQPESYSIMSAIKSEDWDAMSEKDKIEQIPGWDYLAPETKNKWNTYFEWNRPIDTKTYESKGYIGDTHSEPILFGNYDLGSGDNIWHREWNQKRTFFKDFLDPISDEYSVELIGGGFGSKFKNDGMGEKGGTVESWEKLVITHLPTGQTHTIREYNSNSTFGDNKHRKINTSYDEDLDQWVQTYSGAKKYGEELNNFLVSTMSDGSKRKMNIHQSWMNDWFKVTKKNNITLSSSERQDIDDDLEDQLSVDIDIDSRASGATGRYVDGVSGGFGISYNVHVGMDRRQIV